LDEVKHYLLDMDGVILRGPTLIPGAAEFIQRLRDRTIPFLIFTNNSLYTPRDLQMRLSYMGLQVPFEAILTSALATEICPCTAGPRRSARSLRTQPDAPRAGGQDERAPARAAAR